MAAIRDIAATFAAFDAADGNRLRLGSIRRRSRKTAPDVGHGFLLGVPELGALMHIPMLQPEAMAAVASRTLPPPVDLPHYTSTTSVTLGFSNHRGHRHTVHLSHEDRGRHVYILGKTGMGKTTLIESMIAADLAS